MVLLALCGSMPRGVCLDPCFLYNFTAPRFGVELPHQEETFVKSDNEWPSYQWGLGGAKPGFWTPGTYRVEILIDGVKFAEGSFTIE